MSRRRKDRGGEDATDRLTPLDEAVLRTAARPMRMTLDGVTTEVSAAEALLLRQLETGLKGSPHAQRAALERLAAVEVKQRRRIEREIATAVRYVASTRQRIADARARGLPDPEILPHPDDIRVDPEKGILIIGPVTPEDLAACRRTAATRDAWILQAAHERQAAGLSPVPSPDDPAPICLRMSEVCNRTLPPSLRLSSEEAVERHRAACAMKQRERLKALRAAWRAAGQPLPRGWRLPAFLRDGEVLDMLCAFYRDWRRGGSRPEEIDPGVDDVLAVVAAKIG